MIIIFLILIPPELDRVCVHVCGLALGRLALEDGLLLQTRKSRRLGGFGFRV